MEAFAFWATDLPAVSRAITHTPHTQNSQTTFRHSHPKLLCEPYFPNANLTSLAAMAPEPARYCPVGKYNSPPQSPDRSPPRQRPRRRNACVNNISGHDWRGDRGNLSDEVHDAAHAADAFAGRNQPGDRPPDRSGRRQAADRHADPEERPRRRGRESRAKNSHARALSRRSTQLAAPVPSFGRPSPAHPPAIRRPATQRMVAKSQGTPV